MGVTPEQLRDEAARQCAANVLLTEENERLRGELFDAHRMLGLYAIEADAATHERVRQQFNRTDK